jgi:hypothetical protein
VVVGVTRRAELPGVVRDLRRFGSRLRVVPQLRMVSLRVGAPRPLLRALRSDSRIAWIERPRRLRTLAEPLDVVDPATGVAYTWAYDAVRAGPALTAVGGGSPAPIAIVDTGVAVGHPDLLGRVGKTYSVPDGGADVTDLVGHGTFVAGLISAIDGNGVGMRGVAGATPLIVVRAGTSATFTSDAVAAGIVWAVDNGARVVNLSLGGPCPSTEAERSAVRYAHDRNVVVVASSGNDGLLGNTPNCPAAEIGGVGGGPGLGLAVAATRPDGLRAPFSTAGESVSVAAPGAAVQGCLQGLVSTIPPTATQWDTGSCGLVVGGAEGGRWAYCLGTSVAAPIVSAVAALVFAANPGLTADQVIDIVKRSAYRTDGIGWNPETGWGIVDATAAVELARGIPQAPPALEFSVVPRVRRFEIDLAGRAVRALDGGLPSPAVQYLLETSEDGVAFREVAPWSSTAPAGILEAAPGRETWFRATACDSSRTCTTRTAGPLVPAIDEPEVRIAVVRKRGSRVVLRVRLDGDPYLDGAAKVAVAYATARRFRSLGHVVVPFNGAVVLRARATAPGRFRVRARLGAGLDWTQATSVPALVTVRKGAFARKALREASRPGTLLAVTPPATVRLPLRSRPPDADAAGARLLPQPR